MIGGTKRSPYGTARLGPELVQKKRSLEDAAERLVRNMAEPQLNMDIVGNYESEAHQEDSSVERCSAVEAASLSSDFSRPSPQRHSPYTIEAGTWLRRSSNIKMEENERINHLENQLSQTRRALKECLTQRDQYISQCHDMQERISSLETGAEENLPLNKAPTFGDMTSEVDA